MRISCIHDGTITGGMLAVAAEIKRGKGLERGIAGTVTVKKRESLEGRCCGVGTAVIAGTWLETLGSHPCATIPETLGLGHGERDTGLRGIGSRCGVGLKKTEQCLNHWGLVIGFRFTNLSETQLLPDRSYEY